MIDIQVPPSRDGIEAREALRLLRLNESEIEALFVLADRTREAYHPDNEIALCAIVNAKSGRCSENCAFCSQSAHYRTGIAEYPLLSAEEIIARAKKAKEMGARAFSIVTSGGELRRENEIAVICRAIEGITGDIGIECCASLGRASYPVLSRLREAGLTRYHHNLETARSYFPEICTSYAYDESIETIRAVREIGLPACSGGIFGLGESDEQRIELAETLRDLKVDSVPINFLDPRPGTPLAGRDPLDPGAALKIIAVYRLMMPSKDLLVCGGRETTLGEMQSEIFSAGANGMMVGNYLTTAGRDHRTDKRMIEEQGFSLRRPKP